ncbi:MAG: aminotransferase class I/II-fold pyridoxal phosphate-dependent enzyme [Candidatus Brocadiales bacterium]|nr:aminotransferase class I/II-fold pyridoxal phosphate-dependent enzyme [Candidatus Brocadiales bacterium]
MIKAYPRVWVDLTTAEVMSVIFQILNPSKARGRSRMPEFERAYAEFIGTKEAVSFSNCRSALYFSLEALNFKKGDEIIIPAFTFWAEAAVVVLAGLKPVFVDVEFETMNIDASRIEEAITPRTRGILFPHLNGLPADMDTIMDIAHRNNLRVIEDCARTCGGSYNDRRVGSFDIGAFSFGYGKSFYGFGGSMITSDDEAFVTRLRDLKGNFKNISIRGLYQKTLKGCLLKFLSMPLLNGFTLFPLAYRYQTKGAELFASWFRIKKPHYNSVPEDFRTDMFDVQGRMGFRQIRTIDITNRRRRENLKLLNKELSGIPGLHIPPDPPDREHVCVHYAVWTERKKELQEFLMRNNIDAQDESSEDVTQMGRYSSYVNGEFENARKLHDRVIYLPSHPCMSEKDILYIADKVKEFFNT